MIEAYLVLVVGIIVAMIGFVKFKGNPMYALAIGGLLVCAIAIVPMGLYDEWMTETPEAPPATVVPAYEYARFTVNPSVVVTSGYNPDFALNSAETIFTQPAYGNETAHTIAEVDNTTWEDSRASFSIKPIPWAGADANNLATIYYEVTNPDITISTSTDSYHLFTSSGGDRQLIWNGDSTEYVEGSSTMLLTENLTLTLDFDVLQDSYSRIENEFDPVTVNIVFHNGDWSWTTTYTVNFMLTAIYD